MAISHVKVDTIADFTGTVTVYNSQGSTQTVNATGLVRPSDWNSVHNQYMTISGNTSGGSTLSGSNIVFQGAGALTLSGNADTLVFSAPAQSVQTQGAVSVQGSTGAIVFSNSNNVTFGGNASTITASASFNQTVQTQGSVQVQGSTGAISFANGNGITFGGNASTITASHNGLTTARASNDAIGLNTALTANGVAWTVNSSGLSLNIPAFLTTAAQSDHSHGNPTLALTNLSGTTASNSAGLTLSLSAAAPGAGGGPAISAAGGSQSTGTIVFSNSNGVSFGFNAGTITATVTPGAAAGIAAASAGTQVATSGTLKFADSNGISFGLSGSSQLTASYTVPTQTNQSLGIYASSNTTGASSSSTYDARSLSMQFLGGVSGGWSNGSFQVSGPALTSLSVTGALSASSNGSTISLGVGTVTVSATSNTTQSSSGTINLNGLIFAGAGGASVGISNGSIVISGATGGAGGGIAAAAGTQTGTSGTINFANSNGITFGMSGSTQITASHNGITQQSTQPVAVSGQNGSYAFSTLSFSNANGISFGTSAGSAITASHNAITTARASTDAIGLNSAFTAGPLAMTINSSGLSLNASSAAGTTSGFTGANISASITHNTAGLAMSMSVANPGGGGGAALSAGTQSVSTGTVAFANSNGITFGMSGSNQITASYNSTQFAGQGTTFAGANISASMTLNSNGLNLSASVAAPGAAAENNAHNLLGANTAGNTTATGSTIGLSGLNLTLSGTNVSQIVISAPATSSLVGWRGIEVSTNGSTVSMGAKIGSFYGNMDGEWQNSTTMQMLQSTSHVQPFLLDQPLSFYFIRIPMSLSFAASTTAATTGNSSWSYGHSRSHNFALYSRGTGASSQSLQLVASTQLTDQQSMAISANANSTQFSYTNRATFQMSTGPVGYTYDYSSSAASLNFHTSNMTAASGLKMMEFPWATTLEPGQYWLMYGVSSATASQHTNVGTRWFDIMSNYGMSQPNLAFGTIGGATQNSVGPYFGNGSFTTAGGGTTGSLGLSNITTSGSHNKMFFQFVRIA